ncbi:MAG TPA: tetratricopeptide repeat protein [Bacillota bacterium]|jgi:tetratricopeptide (TPR) repeat protein|nr:tetratricopeptide repeat protein [Bacillota bacterium]HOL10224.1 tetratricopeptide repeat protein [Bacillota bacterium]HPO98016.1 tetratricopeptide repeat protein [Bacillota bacterium]
MDKQFFKRLSLKKAFPQLVFIIGLTVILNFLRKGKDGFISFLIAYIVFILSRYLIRYTVTVEHTRGTELLKKGDFQGAIEHFNKSIEYFDAHRALDRWRSILLLSPNQYEYREIALTNIAFAYNELGEVQKAREYYEACLKDYPNNQVAIAAINKLDNEVE